MDRLVKIVITQLCKVVELAKPAKMVKENPVSQICKMQSKASERQSNIVKRFLKIVKFAKVPSPKNVKVRTLRSMLVIFV